MHKNWKMGETSDFLMILYKRSSCSFVKGRFSALREDPVLSAVNIIFLHVQFSCDIQKDL